MPAPADDLPTVLAGAKLFEGLQADELYALVALLEPFDLAGNELVFRQGELGDAMYVLAGGELVVTSNGAEIDRLRPGAVVGEMALLTVPERSATVTAAAEGARLWRLSRASFDRLTAERPQVLEAVHAVGRPRLQRTELAPLLSARFGATTSGEIAALQEAATWRDVARGEKLFEPGDVADQVYLVVSGRFRVLGPDGSVVREVGRGGVIGEGAVVGQATRLHMAVAMRDASVAAFPRDMAAGSSTFVTSVAADLMRRLDGRPTEDRVASAVIALLPASVGAPLTGLAAQLEARFVRWGSTLTLSSAAVDQRFGRDGVSQAEGSDEMSGPLTLWLDQLVRGHEYVVLIGDEAETPWRRRCTRLADTAVLVAGAGDEPLTGPSSPKAPVGSGQARHLVLVHPPTVDLPRGTARWLAEHQVDAHHHVKLEEAAGLDRVARRLAGKAFGIALSGGGARGYVHIGLFRALEEHGVPVDVVYGTSMGALIGAMYALYRDAAAGERLAERFGDRKQLMDRTLPLVALTRSRKVTETLRSLYGEDTRIEDLWVPFTCFSASLTNAELRTHDSGLLWRAVRASTAIPGVFTPVLNDGGHEVLVDGGVMNNLPADLLREFLGPGVVIASNAYGGKTDGKAMSFGDDVSGWAVLRSKLLPFGARVRAPSLLGTLMRSTSLASKSLLDEASRHADLVVTYPSSEVTSLEFDSYEETIAVGYRHASEALGAWLHPTNELDH